MGIILILGIFYVSYMNSIFNKHQNQRMSVINNSIVATDEYINYFEARQNKFQLMNTSSSNNWVVIE